MVCLWLPKNQDKGGETMSNKRRPQGDGTIRKRADGRWEGRIIIGHKKNGSPMFKSVFGKTQKSTLKQLHQLIDLYRDVDLTEECRMTLGEWLDKWLDEYMLFTIKESTLRSYRTMADHYIKRYIGNKQLVYLTTADIQRLYNKIKKEGRVVSHPIHKKQLSDSMVRSVHMLLHQALDVAVKERLIVRNPTQGTTIPKQRKTEKQVLNDNQLEIFLNAIKEELYWYDFFYVEIMTGLRRGEICGLKWEDINFIENTLSVKRSISKKTGGGIVVGETKTGAGMRTMVIPPSVVEILEQRKTKSMSEWIFPYPINPTNPLYPDLAYRKLHGILQKAELPLIRFHDLRHTFATHAMQGGVDAKTLSGILGHTDASFTLDTYTHVTSDMQRNASVVVNTMMQPFLIGEK